MSIFANQSAFPIPDGREPGEDGMTYRQWLIGMALQGLLASNIDELVISADASAAIQAADAVIARLDAEQANQ